MLEGDTKTVQFAISGWEISNEYVIPLTFALITVLATGSALAVGRLNIDELIPTKKAKISRFTPKSSMLGNFN